jgi:hypothetical protein
MHGTHRRTQNYLANLVSIITADVCASHVRPPPDHPQTTPRPPRDQHRAMSGNTRSISLILDLGSTSAPGISFRVFRVFRGFNCCFQVEPPGGTSSLRQASQPKLGLPPGDECVKMTHSGGPRRSHPMRPQSHPKATPRPVDSQLIATIKPP